MVRPVVLGLGLLLIASPVMAQIGPPNPDANRDGKVTWPEYRAMSGGQMIDQLDADKDARISKAEFKSMMDKVKVFAGAAMVARATDRFNQDDQNRDGFMTIAEAETAAKTRFDRGDSNKDGWLSKAERQDMRKVSRGGSGS